MACRLPAAANERAPDGGGAPGRRVRLRPRAGCTTFADRIPPWSLVMIARRLLAIPALRAAPRLAPLIAALCMLALASCRDTRVLARVGPRLVTVAHFQDY